MSELAIYGTASRMMGIRREIKNLTQDMVNVRSNGYFPSYLDVFPLQNDREGSPKAITFAQVAHERLDTSQGVMEDTGNPLDIALQGPGFLMIQTPDGVRYTRKGHLFLNPEGQAVDDLGNLYLDEGGAPITLPSKGDISIQGNGHISTEQGVIGKLGIVHFENAPELKRWGHGYYTSEEVPQPDRQTTVLQGTLEMPNLSTIDILTRMMELNHDYQHNQYLLDSHFSARNKFLNAVGTSLKA